MRKALGATLARHFAKKPEHHLFCGDIGYGVFDQLRRQTPDQFHNFGISEQHMVAFAAGFAKTLNATSLLYTITPFLTSRVHDQLRVDVAYMKAPLVICSVGGGFAYDTLGFTHFGLDDLALMTSLPNMRIVTPSEPDDVTVILNELFATAVIEKPCYLRLQKGGEPSLKANYPDFTDMKDCRYWDGDAVEIITHGAIAEEALKAREALKGKIPVAVRCVIDWQNWLDDDSQQPDNTKKTIFLEEHRNSGLLAHQMFNRGKVPHAFKLCCVENSEFADCTSRKRALQLNSIDAASLVDLISNWDFA